MIAQDLLDLSVEAAGGGKAMNLGGRKYMATSLGARDKIIFGPPTR